MVLFLKKVKTKKPMTNKAVEEIATALAYEGMNGLVVRAFQKMEPKKRNELLEKCLVQPFSSRHIVSINEEPVSYDSFISGTPGIVSTKGDYAIVYNSTNTQIRKKCKAYSIYSDLLRFKLEVSGPVHLREIAKRIPEVKWLLRNTTFSNSLFALAKMHPGVNFDFSVDWVRYAGMIEAKAEKMGLNIEHRPFVCYKCNEKDFDNKYNKKFLADKHDEKFYEQELKEADKVAEQEGEE